MVPRSLVLFALAAVFFDSTTSDAIFTATSPETNNTTEHTFLRILETSDVAYVNCVTVSSINEFPTDLFTNTQRRHGALLLHVFAAVYFFTLLAVVCNDYFLPSVECICEDLNISKDVAAATFMATATTTPELFTNVISTFITDSDLGVGTIIGSLMFNTLGVAAVASLAAREPVKLERWPITRDCILFSINILFLVWFAWDAKITLDESIGLMVLYVIYFIILFNNKNIKHFVYWIGSQFAKSEVKSSFNIPQETLANPQQVFPGIYSIEKGVDGVQIASKPANEFSIPPISQQNSFSSRMAPPDRELIPVDKMKKRKTLWGRPDGSLCRKTWWAYTWPIKFLLTCAIPNPKTWRRLYPVTFIMCIVFIGFNAYMIVWMITVMGYTLSVPESVMGLTFLAAGGCMPEAISSVLMVRKGEGGIGVSNSLGANSLAILMSLGLPWLIRNIIHRSDPERSYIKLDSADIEYTILSLLMATIVLYAVISLAKYALKKSVGVILITVYLVFITLCILLEMDIIFPSRAC